MDKKNLLKRLASFIVILILLVSSMYNGEISSAAVSKEPRLNVKNLNITKDTTYKLRVYNTKKYHSLDFSSSDSDIVTIRKTYAKSCTLKSKASGSAVITVTVSNSNDEDDTATLKCKVNVSPPAFSVKFSKKKLKLTEGDSKKLGAVVKPNITSEQPKYSSDNNKIATVSSTGTVIAVSPGQAIIRASIANGKNDYYTVIVSADDVKATETPTSNPTASPSAEPEPTASPAPTTLPSDIPTPGKAPGRSKNKYKYDPFSMNENIGFVFGHEDADKNNHDENAQGVNRDDIFGFEYEYTNKGIQYRDAQGMNKN